MADSSIIYIDGAPSAKRKRQSGPAEPSTSSPIKDPRTSISNALHFHSGVITILVGGDEPEDDSLVADEGNNNADADDSNQNTFVTIEEAEDDNGATPFHVHEDIIAKRSPYIANTLKPQWSALRSDPRKIKLPDADPDTFNIYLNHLYTGRLPILGEPSQPNIKTDNYRVLSRAYVLGELLMDTVFQNAVADALIVYARADGVGKRAYPTHNDIRIIYDGTREDSPIRKLFVDIWCKRGKIEWLDKPTSDELPTDFLIAVTKGLMQDKPPGEVKSRPWRHDHMQYHIPKSVRPSGQGD